MLETMTQDTETATGLVGDADIVREVNACDQLARLDGRPFNAKFMWSVILDPRHSEIVGDELIVLATIASLTKHPAYGCRATHRQLAARASVIKRLFILAHRVSWARIAIALGIGE